ncbi:MAG TPA: hypothetical protein VKA64_09030 [Gammaproteobacteria bacterium]|nr:hypothetical protein [Gammaproteobacteria bacterium]
MHRLILSALIALCSLPASAAGEQDQIVDRLTWDFAEFVHHFRGRNWEGVCRFVTDRTKAGFGGEAGCIGVRQVFAENERCWEEMVFTLRQGCKRTGSGANLSCVAPPQFTDDRVSYLGARAAFSYKRESKRWMADYLICGGD